MSVFLDRISLSYSSENQYYNRILLIYLQCELLKNSVQVEMKTPSLNFWQANQETTDECDKLCYAC